MTDREDRNAGGGRDASAPGATDGRPGRRADSLRDLAPVVALVGHAGVGKTNLALNLALAATRAGRHVAVADMDVVNPYFRSSDYPDLLADAGVALIAPTFARTALDTPSLSGRLDAVLAQLAARGSAEVADVERAARGPAAPTPGTAGGAGADEADGLIDHLIIDVGGDDDGATALGRYAAGLRAAGVRTYYVVNAFRNLTQTPEEAAALVPGIQRNAHLEVCGVVNTSNLMGRTTLDDVAHGRAFAARVAEILGVPLVATAVPRVAVMAGRAATDGRAAAEVPADEVPSPVAVAALPLAEALGGSVASGDSVANGALDAGAHGEELLVMERFVRTPWG